eukprot:COSAG01_NODE_6492_length_3633_cov_2.276174_6_plen_76_part_00
MHADLADSRRARRGHSASMEMAHRVPGMGAWAAGVGTTTEGTATSLNLPTYLPSHRTPSVRVRVKIMGPSIIGTG